MRNNQSFKYDYYLNKVLDCEDVIDVTCVSVGVAQAYVQGSLSLGETLDLLQLLLSMRDDFLNDCFGGE